LCPLQRSWPDGVRLTRRFHPPARSAPGVSHTFDGLLLQRASGPFQTGATRGVHPSELCSSSDSRAPFGVCTLVPFLVTAVFHSEAFGRSRFSAASEFFSVRGVRTQQNRRSAQGRCSLGFHPLQGAHRRAMAGTSTRLPPRTWARPASEEVVLACASRCCCALRSGELLPVHRPS